MPPRLLCFLTLLLLIRLYLGYDVLVGGIIDHHSKYQVSTSFNTIKSTRQLASPSPSRDDIEAQGGFPVSRPYTYTPCASCDTSEHLSSIRVSPCGIYELVADILHRGFRLGNCLPRRHQDTRRFDALLFLIRLMCYEKGLSLRLHNP